MAIRISGYAWRDDEPKAAQSARQGEGDKVTINLEME